MKNQISFLFFCLITLLHFSCSSTKNSTGQNRVELPLPQLFLSNVVADGNLQDWKNVIMQFDKNSSARYAVANDTQNLYVAIVFSNAIEKLKVLQSGMDVWLDLEGRKSKLTGIHFPLNVQSGMVMSDPSSRNGQNNQDEMLRKLIISKREFELSGFNNNINGLQSLTANNSGVTVALGVDKEDLIYELKEPFSSFTQPIVFGKQISFGITINKMTLPQSGFGGMSGSMPGGGPGGMPGGTPPAGMQAPGGMRPPGGGQMPDMSEIQKLGETDNIWYKFALAHNNSNN